MSSPYSIEYFRQNEASAAEQFDRAQWRVAEDRSKFFERLALLSSGAVVLSVSLLSTVFGKTTIHGIAFLFVGWAAFILSLMTSLFRELKSHSYRLEIYFSHYQSMLADKKTFLFTSAVGGQRVVNEPQEDGSVQRVTPEALREEASETREDAKRRKDRANGLMKTMRTLELTAINAFWVGVLLLAVFAGTNVILGVGHHYFK
jgi:hypothetical protein